MTHDACLELARTVYVGLARTVYAYMGFMY